MNTPNLDEALKITARELNDTERLQMLPKHFGHLMLTVESAIFNFMAQLSSDYQGGFWSYYELSNGGMYMAPASGQNTYRISVDGNGYEGTMSADAAGITACLFTLSHLSFAVHDERIAEHFYRLREFAFDHREASAIIAATD